MAFKRRTKRGGGGNRTTITYNTSKGTTRSSSWSSTGSQKTGSGGVRYTTRYNPGGTVTKSETHHGANGWITRKSKTIGKIKEPNKYNRSKYFSAVKNTKSSGSRRANKAFTKNDSAGLFLLAMIFGGAWVLITYWQWIVAILAVVLVGWLLIKFNKKTEDEAAYEEWLKNKSAE